MIDLINILNGTGDTFCKFILAMLMQSGILIVLLYLIDLLIRKHVRAVFRYCIWMLVFVKLVLPPTLCVPTGIGYWCGLDSQPVNTQVSVDMPEMIVQPPKTQSPVITYDSTYIPPVQPIESESVVVAAVNPTISITWQAIVFLVWLVGLLVLSVLLFQRFLFVKSLLAQSDKANGRLDETLQQCCRQVGIRKNIELRLSKNMLSPAACGLFKPVILMPGSLLENLSSEKLRAVLIHELAHIKRGDLWINFIQTILQIIYFYNPLLWFANAVVRGLREKAVDEMVLTKLGDEADSYSSTLIDIAEIAFSKPHFSLRLVGVVESKKALSDRIKHILSRPFPKTAKLGIAGLMAIIITAAILLPMAKAGPSGANDKFKAVLSNGLTVELVGVHLRNAENKTWWQPDGSKLGESIETVDLSSYDSVDPAYDFVFKTSGDGAFKVESIKGSNVIFGVQVPGRADMTGCRGHINESVRKTNIKIASPSGKWKTIVKSAGGGSVSGKMNGKTIVLAAAEQAGDSVIISCSNIETYKNATRIIAIDSKGNEITGKIKTDTGVDGLRQRTIRFVGFNLSDIKEFKFQTCPYEYFTFENVSLKPGHKTDVQIESPNSDNKQKLALEEDQNFKFGNNKEFILPADYHFLNFEKGQIISNDDNDKDSKWAIETGVDIAVESKDSRLRLWGSGCVFAELLPQHWKTMTPEELSIVLDTYVLLGQIDIFKQLLPRTFAFKTRKGGAGILQITGFIQNPDGLKIRYKMVENDLNTKNTEIADDGSNAKDANDANIAAEGTEASENKESLSSSSTGAKAVKISEHWNVKTDLSQDVIDQRNKLLAEADSKIRSVLVELADKFPQLKKARDWEQDTLGHSAKGRIGIHLFHSDQGKIKTAQQAIPENDRYSVLIIVNEPPKEPTQLSMGLLYPNLGLVGQIGTTAGDPELDEALEKLVEEALEPLQSFNQSLNNNNAQLNEEQNIIWGQAVWGLQVAVEFIPEKRCYSFGEKIGIQFKIQNVSDETIILPTTTWRFGEESKCIITDKDEKTIPVNQAWFSGWSKVDRHEILPGEVVTIKATSLMLFADDSYPEANQMVGYWATVEPGNYSIQFELQFPDISRKDAQGNTIVPLPNDWHGTLTTGAKKLCMTSVSDMEKEAKTSQSPAEPNSANFEAPLNFNKDIPLGMVVGTKEQPDIIKIDSIRFEMRGDQIVHKLYGFFLRPWPHTDWRFRFELVDGSGSIVGSIKYNMHNRGRSETQTTNEPEPVESDFCPIGTKGLTEANNPARFVISIEQKRLETENITRRYNIRGTVMDATENMPDEFWKEFEAAQTPEEADKVFKKDWGYSQVPLSNVTITLKGNSLTKETVLDSQGKFEFLDLLGPTFGPYGGMVSCETYEIFAQIPVQHDANEQSRMMPVKQYVKLDSDKNITLKLRKDLITIKGKITDANGQPISGAKIIARLGINDHAMDGYWENHTPPKWVAVSKDDGSYELEGIEPQTNFYRVGGYLYSGRPYTYVDIHVKASGFAQDGNNITKVPLISEDMLYQARRFWKLANQIAQRADRPEMHEKKELNLPSVNGNTITGIHIVLERVGAVIQE